MREVLDLAWRLLLVCILSAGSLAGVYEVTADRIQENRQRQKIELLKKVLPAAERFEAVEKGDVRYEVGYRGEERVGGVFYVTEKGYGGPVQAMVGIDTEGKVVEVLLLSHKETPGLGTKVANPEFRSQFLGKNGPFSLRKDDPAGNIDAVASATISSRAVTRSVDRAVKQFQQEWEKHG